MAITRRSGGMATLLGGLLLAGCGDGGGSSASSTVSVVAGSTVTPAASAVVEATPAPTAAATSTPTVAATAAPTTAAAVPTATGQATLAPLDLSDMRLWNYGGKWHASEWADSMSPIDWKFDHVTQPAGTDTYFRLDAAGAPELQDMTATAATTRGLWEADVTLPTLKAGLVVAPLWLYDQASGDEVDFEYAGRNGLDLTLHAKVGGTMQQSSVRLFAGRDMSGERHRFGIKVDESAGYVEMYLDGVRMQRWERTGSSVFVSNPLKPIMSMWAANPYFSAWVGNWAGLGSGETLTMTVHGYGFTALP